MVQFWKLELLVVIEAGYASFCISTIFGYHFNSTRYVQQHIFH